MIDPKENAASGATDSGVQKNSKAPNLHTYDKSKQAEDSSLSYAYVQKAHAASVRAMGYALTLGDDDGWINAARVWAMRLTEVEVVNLATASLRLLSPEMARQAIEHFPQTTGCPVAPFFSAEDEADSWTNFASNDELRAYLLACFNSLAPKEQKEFIGYVQRRSVARSSNLSNHQARRVG